MRSKVIDFTSYERKNLMIEIAPLEAVEDFCRFVDGPWLFSRRARTIRRVHRERSRKRRALNTIITECEWCGVVAAIPIQPPNSPYLCERCKALTYYEEETARIPWD